MKGKQTLDRGYMPNRLGGMNMKTQNRQLLEARAWNVSYVQQICSLS